MLEKLRRVYELTVAIQKGEVVKKEQHEDTWFLERTPQDVLLEQQRRERSLLVFEVDEVVKQLPSDYKWVVQERFFKGKSWKLVYETTVGVKDNEYNKWIKDTQYRKKKIDNFNKKVFRNLKKFF